MTNKYFQTTHLTQEQFNNAHEVAESQENAIMRFFNNNPASHFTASEVEYKLKSTGKIGPRVPLTSVRRAMSTLQKYGRINRMNEYRIGIHGVPEHYYQLSTGWGKSTENDTPTLF
ncbi:hypothetical protein [Chitinophaga nivalis]|uniref:Uncharacterized protein n=1 Tax=Chitinophaga nivalis TaxID=2991709 RepID=A0ABT3IIJ1_9BACT|nr:hypothetical protein [Chitinophaga nivalis]MCW3466531.1 hypothetical protein [Chitinophaga nivalis]MCW3483778.1 hypothetical protein [Chitinophaga nivalis]